MAVAELDKIFGNMDDNRYYGNSREDGARLLGQARVFNIYSAKFLESLRLPQGGTRFALDLGCGPAAALEFTEKYTARIIAVDNDEVKLTQAAAIVNARNLRDRVKLVHSNASDLRVVPTGSIGLVYMRLFLEHVDVATRKGIMDEIDRVTEHGATIVAEDLDLDLDVPSWNSVPQSASHRRMHEAMVTFYRGRGAEPRMGPKLQGLFESSGLEVVGVDSYSHASGANDLFTPFHWKIMDAIRVPIERFGIMIPEEFALHRKRFEQDLRTEGTVVYTPRMYQVAARKS